MKLETYNKRLLAILGSVAVIFLLIALFSFLVYTINDMRRNNYPEETGILSDEKIEELQRKQKRQQVISYNTPKLVDTVNSIYMIPVSHKDLEKEEAINRGLLNAMGSSSVDYENEDERYSANFYGKFNNLLLYDAKSQTTNKLFEKRINFNNIRTEYFEDDILILIQASNSDTYKDGVINLQDLSSLYIYSFAQKKLKTISQSGMDAYQYDFLYNAKDLIVAFGIDKNEDGRYTEFNEPTRIKKYNFETGVLDDLIDETVSEELQKTLEGSK